MLAVLVAFTFFHQSGWARSVAIMLNATGTSTTTSNPMEGYISKAVTLAVRHAGARGERLIWIDHGENAKKTLEAIEEYNRGPASVAIGMGNSFQALLAGQLMASNKLLISPVATADEILASRGQVVLLGNTNWTQARAMARELKRRAPASARILVARLNGCVYCVSMADHLARALGATFANVDVVDLAQLGVDRRKDARRYGDFDHVFVPTLEAEAARVLALLWKDNPKATYWGTDGWGSLARYVRELPFAKNLKVFWVSHYFPAVPTNANRKFVRAYRRAYRSDPVDTSALYYEATVLTLRRLARSSDPRRTFSSLGSYAGLTGRVRVLGRRVSRPMPLLTLVGGAPRLVKMVTAE